MTKALGSASLHIQLKEGYVTVYGADGDNILLHGKAEPETWGKICQGIVDSAPSWEGPTPDPNSIWRFTLTLKTHYLEMFFKRGYILTVESLDLLDDRRRCAMTVLMPYKHAEAASNYATYMTIGKDTGEKVE